MRDYGSGRRLAATRVGAPEHSCVGHRGVGDEDRLELARRNLKPAASGR